MFGFLCIQPNSLIFAEVYIVDPSIQSGEVPLELNSVHNGCGSFCMKVRTSKLFHTNPKFQLLSITEFFVETLGLYI